MLVGVFLKGKFLFAEWLCQNIQTLKILTFINSQITYGLLHARHQALYANDLILIPQVGEVDILLSPCCRCSRPHK